MFFEIDGVKYNVVWRYGKRDKTYISVQNKLTGDRLETFVKCFAYDILNKDTGRKASLTKALNLMDMGRDDRKIVWEAYRTMSKTPRWKLHIKRVRVTTPQTSVG